MNVNLQHFEAFMEAAHYAGQKKLILCSSGNLSYRIGNQVLISGTGTWLPKIKEHEIAVCNLETGVLQNGVKPSMESMFHLDLLRKRPEINVVFHCQSRYATVIACMKNKPTNFNVTAEIPCYVGREIPIVPYYRPGSSELAKAVVEALQNHDAALLTNHGQVFVGTDFDDALQKATFFRNGL